jgi:nucleotide-binding universal stress UspA family protein
MLPFKKVLCPTDFSAPSCEAVSAASEVARMFSAPLVLVHVVQPLPAAAAAASGYPIDVEALESALVKHATQQLHEFARTHVAKDVRTVVRAVRGSVAAQILDVASDEGVDLIVISTHGETGLRHVLLGSVAEKVVRTAACPVLTVHCGHRGPP